MGSTPEASGRTEFGPGTVAPLPELVVFLGRDRVFVMTDAGLSDASATQAVALVGRWSPVACADGPEEAQGLLAAVDEKNRPAPVDLDFGHRAAS